MHYVYSRMKINDVVAASDCLTSMSTVLFLPTIFFFFLRISSLHNVTPGNVTPTAEDISLLVEKNHYHPVPLVISGLEMYVT